MTVYVDDAGTWTLLSRLLRRKHHLYADSTEELRLAADRAGVPGRIWYRGTPSECVYVTSRRRRELLAHGAVALSWPLDSAALVGRRRAERRGE